MATLVLQYSLSALLGYLLFVGIAGRLRPWRRPARAAARPNWFLGIWTGLVVALVAGASLHIATGMEPSRLPAFFSSTLVALASSQLAGIAAYLLYQKSTRAVAPPVQSWAAEYSAHVAIAKPASSTLESPLSDTHFEQLIDDLGNELAQQQRAFAEPAILEGMPLREPHHEVMQEHPLAGMDIRTGPTPVMLHLLADSRADETAEFLELDDSHAIGDDSRLAIGLIHEETRLAEAANGHVFSEEAALQEITDLRRQLNDETALRRETETHLRITRSALSRLENASRQFESDKASALIGIEEALADSTREASTAADRAQHEYALRVQASSDVLTLRHELQEAQHEIERLADARNQSMTTANKAVSISRRALQSRAQLQLKIQQMEKQLADRNRAVENLLQSLDDSAVTPDRGTA